MKNHKALLALTLLIATLDVVFVLMSIYFSRHTFEATLFEEATSHHEKLNVSLNQTYNNLLMIASLYANSPRIQELFYNGFRAVENEGGGPGGPEADKWRKALFAEVGESWLVSSQQFRIRQLHFHLGPGSISFLRVHSADKFGDTLDHVRHTIVETNKTQRNQIGFETGRVYSGLRGVVPMYYTDPKSGERVHTGALEAGTSFSKILQILDDGLGAAFSILLSEKHIEQTMWPQARESLFGNVKTDCQCVIEATSREGVEDLLPRIPKISSGIPNMEQVHLVPMGDRTMAATLFPLRDFKGGLDPQRDHVGAVLIWDDVTDKLHALQRQHWVTVLYAVFGFIVLELMLIAAFGIVTRRLNQVIQERTKELEYEVAVRNRFFSIIAHDLRSPFTVLLGMTRMLEEYVDKLSREKLKAYAGHIHDTSERLHELLQGLLDWSSLQMNKNEINKDDFDISVLVSKALETQHLSAEEKEITIHNTIPSQTVHADFQMISTVVRNLIANAIKFVEPGGKITVHLDDTDTQTTLSVTDNGCGLDPKVIPKLFKIDEIVTTSGTLGERGTGLGLPLCKDMIERHGGTIKAENNPERGATFSFSLPKQ